jgi:hypothetical protein
MGAKMIDGEEFQTQYDRHGGVISGSDKPDEQLRKVLASALRAGRIIRSRLRSMLNQKTSKLVVEMLEMVDRENEMLTDLEKEVGKANQSWCASVLEGYRARRRDPAILDAVELMLQADDKSFKPPVGDGFVGVVNDATIGPGKNNSWEMRCHAAFQKIGIGVIDREKLKK